jgi:Domain of unknown function (DUF4149)
MYYHSRMNLLRFLMLLYLSIWLGALIFFPVVAQTSFSSLPSSDLAGIVVRGSLIKLHWIGLGCGVVFLICSLIYNRTAFGDARALSLPHAAIALMLALTAVSQFMIIPRMDALRAQAGEIATLSADNPLRQSFDSLHVWSTRLESIVLLFGLVVLYITSRRSASSRA